MESIRLNSRKALSLPHQFKHKKMKKYVAELNGQRYEIELEGDTIKLNGKSQAYSFETLGNGLHSLLLDNQSLPVFAQAQGHGKVRVSLHGRTSQVVVKDEKDLLLEKFGVSRSKDTAASELHAPMPGLVLKIYVEVGQSVKAGERILSLEAMKMENELKAAADVTIKSILVQPGDAVGKNATLVEFA